MAGKTIVLEEKPISEILLADLDSESGAETIDVIDKPQQKTNDILQQVAEDFQPGDRLKEGTQIFIPLSVLQKVKKVRLHTSTKTAQHCLC
jgi:hypothetical protein